MPKIFTIDLEVPSGSRPPALRDWLAKMLIPHRMVPISCVEAQVRTHDWLDSQDDLTLGSTWEYKGVVYVIAAGVNMKRLIQYEDNWYPIVSYALRDTDERTEGLVFYRSTAEWVEKFKRVE